MSDPSPYSRLGVSESASFDEVQQARDQAIAACSEDERCRSEIEMAYDAILMQRLKLRQEGRIAVPDGVRQADARPSAPPKKPTTVPLPTLGGTPDWLQSLMDRPTGSELLLGLGIFGSLAGLSLMPQLDRGWLQLLLVGGTAATTYLIGRKEGRYARALLLALGCLVLGMLVASAIAPPLQEVLLLPLGPDALATALTLLLFWAGASLLR